MGIVANAFLCVREGRYPRRESARCRLYLLCYDMLYAAVMFFGNLSASMVMMSPESCIRTRYEYIIPYVLLWCWLRGTNSKDRAGRKEGGLFYGPLL